MNKTPRQTRHGHMARVSKLALGEQALPIRFMYKTVPEHANDTGWRLFTGYEDDEFLAEFENLPPVPIQSIVDKDASLDALLDNNAGSVWERPPGQPWQQVHDFEIPYEEVDVEINGDLENLMEPVWK
ncbi:MAG: DUF2185 domain-containing protein [Gammaproteobacteria bacterium]|nr:DUF2185 domain-containing protein [Gammaproteobacteria bacterium]MCP4881382.1 DUF2185 domain-containing protein [Gammaproteobacteria bacterium]MDP6165403.1 DUF2185 domain-containing protein [Gammaproteobacteria bacterium]